MTFQLIFPSFGHDGSWQPVCLPRCLRRWWLSPCSCPKSYTANASIILDIRGQDPDRGYGVAGSGCAVLPDDPGRCGDQQSGGAQVVRDLKLNEMADLRKKWQNATQSTGDFEALDWPCCSKQSGSPAFARLQRHLPFLPSCRPQLRCSGCQTVCQSVFGHHAGIAQRRQPSSTTISLTPTPVPCALSWKEPRAFV